MKAPLQQQLLLLIQAHPGISKSELALKVSRRSSSLSRPLGALISDGKIRPAQNHTYYPWQPIEPELVTYHSPNLP